MPNPILKLRYFLAFDLRFKLCIFEFLLKHIDFLLIPKLTLLGFFLLVLETPLEFTVLLLGQVLVQLGGVRQILFGRSAVVRALPHHLMLSFDSVPLVVSRLLVVESSSVWGVALALFKDWL